MKICFVIPTYNRKDYLERLLTQITGNSDDDHTISTIVVVDGSTDGTNEMLSNDFPEVKAVQGSGNWWYTRCLNEGCKLALESDPDFVITMNDDTEIRTDFVNQLLNASNVAGLNGIIGSINLSIGKPHKITFAGVKKIDRWRLKKHHYLPMFTEYDEIKHNGIHRTYSLMTRGLLIPSSILKKLDYFDESFIQYGSDEDFCLRAIKAGYNAYVCWDAIVYENVRLTSKGTAYNKPSPKEFIKSLFNKYSVNSIRKNIRFYSRHGIPVLLPVYLVILFLGTLKSQIWNYRNVEF